METIDVKISSLYPPNSNGSIRAYASVTLDKSIGIRGIKVVEGGRDGLFIAMPSRKTENGYKEICFPVTAEFREKLHDAVLTSYRQAIAQNQAPVQASEQAEQELQPEVQNTMQMGGM